MHQKGKHNIKISSEKKIWQLQEELGYAFNRFHWTIPLTTCTPWSLIHVDICELEICEIKNSLHCLGLVNADIFYANRLLSLPCQLQMGTSPNQVLVDDSNWSFRFRGPDGVYIHPTAVGSRELASLLSWIKLIIWFVNALFRNIKFDIAPPKKNIIYTTP